MRLVPETIGPNKLRVHPRTGEVMSPGDPEYDSAFLKSKSAGEEERGQREKSYKQKQKLRLGKHKTQMSYAAVSNEVESIKLKEEKMLKLVRREVAPAKKVTDVSLSLASPNAVRLIWFLISKVNAREDKHFWTHRTTAYRLGCAIGLKYDLNYKQAKRFLNEVAGLVFTIQRNNGTSWLPAIARADLDDDDGFIRIKLNDELKPYLLDLEKFRRIYPGIADLRSTRTMLFYQYLRKFVGLDIPVHHVPLETIQRVAHSEGVPWKEFKRTYLDPAIKNIKKKTELKTVSYKPKREGGAQRGKVVSLQFLIRSLTKKKMLALRAASPERTWQL